MKNSSMSCFDKYIHILQSFSTTAPRRHWWRQLSLPWSNYAARLKLLVGGLWMTPFVRIGLHCFEYCSRPYITSRLLAWYQSWSTNTPVELHCWHSQRSSSDAEPSIVGALSVRQLFSNWISSLSFIQYFWNLAWVCKTILPKQLWHYKFYFILELFQLYIYLYITIYIYSYIIFTYFT